MHFLYSLLFLHVVIVFDTACLIIITIVLTSIIGREHGLYQRRNHRIRHHHWLPSSSPEIIVVYHHRRLPL
jgi:hypothetical protein